MTDVLTGPEVCAHLRVGKNYLARVRTVEYVMSAEEEAGERERVRTAWLT